MADEPPRSITEVSEELIRLSGTSAEETLRLRNAVAAIGRNQEIVREIIEKYVKEKRIPPAANDPNKLPWPVVSALAQRELLLRALEAKIGDLEETLILYSAEEVLELIKRVLAEGRG